MKLHQLFETKEASDDEARENVKADELTQFKDNLAEGLSKEHQ